MKRGDIYYVRIPHWTGSEMAKDRPAVVVSCDALNDTSPTVVVVYLTATPKRWTPGHVAVSGTPRPSTALCEQIFTVDKTRFGEYVGSVTEDEMSQIEKAICRTLDLPWLWSSEPDESDEATVQEIMAPETEAFIRAATDAEEARRKAEAELEVYKHLYAEMLDRISKF